MPGLFEPGARHWLVTLGPAVARTLNLAINPIAFSLVTTVDTTEPTARRRPDSDPKRLMVCRGAARLRLQCLWPRLQTSRVVGALTVRCANGQPAPLQRTS